MKISCLIENTSRRGLPCEHGLSLHLHLNDGRVLLFDMGQTALFAENAQTMGLQLQHVDMAILSHGHYDHGGGLPTFLRINGTSKVYLKKEAFQSHYSLRADGLVDIGLDSSFRYHPQLVFCDVFEELSPGMMLFSDVKGRICYPPGNRFLYGPDAHTNDTFMHEQNLWITEGEHRVLLAGCAHAGIVNIIEKAIELTGTPPTHVIAGMHLMKSGLSPQKEERFIAELAEKLKQYSQTTYYTMHCTGDEAYQKLKRLMPEQLHRLTTGDQLDV